MPYQLLYTLSAGAAPSTGAAGGCVCSENMPPGVQQELMAAIHLRRAAAGEPVFLYFVFAAGGRIYHAMVCTAAAKTPDSATVHALVFAESETAILQRQDMHPTPAGVMAGLLRTGFWQKYPLPETPPRLAIHEDSLPLAEGCPTWTRLSGNGNNAAKPNEKPYDARCAYLLPPHTAAEDVLCLFHESDSLTPACGWGVSFCTAGDGTDAGSALRRTVCTEGSAALRAARMAGRPCFPVRKATQNTVAVSAYRPQYFYTEEEDALFYPVRRKLPRRTRSGLLWVLGCAAVIAAALYLLSRGGTVPRRPAAAPPAAATAHPAL